MHLHPLRRALATICLLLALPLPAFSASASGTAPTWRLVGQIGGPVNAVAVQGKYAFVGIGLRLVTLDVSDPARPVEIGATVPFPDFVADVTLAGAHAYVAAGGSGLRVVDIADPGHPTEIGAWDSPGYAEGVAVAGSIAYLADGPYGLRMINVTDPTHPTPLSAAYDLNYAFDVAVVSQHAYVAAAGAGLLVADVTDPVRPVEVATLDTPGYAYGLANDSSGRPLVYVADGWEGVRVVNVADPAHPAETGGLTPRGWAFGIAAVGTQAYVAAAFGGLQILDIEDPREPRLLGGQAAADGHAGRVAVSGALALVADSVLGLHLIDVANAARPSLVHTVQSMAYASRLALTGDHAYVVTAGQGLRIINVTNPGGLVEVGHYDALPAFNDVVAESDLVYVDYFGGPDGTLHVLDVSDPPHPRRLGAAGRAGNDMEVSGGIAYLSDEWGLTLVSVADPANPYPLGGIQIQEYPGGPGTTSGVAIDGRLAYVAAQHEGVKIVDVSDPAHPSLYGAIRSEANYTLDLVVQGSIAYLADLGGLRIVDVSDPRHPRELSYLYLGIDVYDINIAGGLAYMVRSTLGVTVVDVRDPAAPVVVGEIDTLGSADQVAIVGNRLYIADGPGGLAVYERTTGRTTVALSAAAPTPGPPGTTHTPARPLVSPRRGPIPQPASPALPDMPYLPPIATQPDVPAPAARSAGACMVRITADAGAGTLRACLEAAVAGDVVTFDVTIFPLGHPATITLASALPALSQGRLTLDGSGAGVVLDGSRTPADTPGIFINSSDNVIQGLQVVNFPHTGIWIYGASGNRIGGDRTRGEGNRVSGNRWGIGLSGATAAGNTVSGNLIGVDASGARRHDNEVSVSLADGAHDNTIGGPDPGQSNVVGGASGIVLEGAAVAYNTVRGNLVGTDIYGAHILASEAPPPCCQAGITLIDGAHHNTIGPGNVVNGFASGIGLVRRGTADNRIIGNRVGTDAAGSHALGNTMDGISIADGAHDNVIGGATSAERNLVSGNTGSGIGLGGATTSGNRIAGNYVGTDVTGQIALPNGNGITLWSPGNQVEGNLASGNLGGGITMLYRDSHENTIAGNWCGVDVTGSRELPNLNHGISAEGGAWGNRIENNLVSGNARAGIAIWDVGADYHAITGNVVGTDVGGTRAIPNGWLGITIGSGKLNRVGGTGPGEGNLVSGNPAGIGLYSLFGTGNLVLGNLVGTDVSGSRPLGNTGPGIVLDSGVRAVVGGASPAERNVVAGNREGIRIQSSGNLVAGNAIGTDVTGRLALGSSLAGVTVWYGSHNFIQGNRIAGEQADGAGPAQFGAHIELGQSNTLRRNEIDGSQEPPIRLDPGTNGDLPAPVLLGAARTHVAGMTCPGCTVELFSDDEDEGRVYEGTASADTRGEFTFRTPSALAGPHITATVTDGYGNTSQFSAPRRLETQLYLPLILARGAWIARRTGPPTGRSSQAP